LYWSKVFGTDLSPDKYIFWTKFLVKLSETSIDKVWKLEVSLYSLKNWLDKKEEESSSNKEIILLEKRLSFRIQIIFLI